MSELIQVELIQSTIARDFWQKKTMLGLGLRKRHQVRYLKNTPATLAMANKYHHLVKATIVKASDVKPAAKVKAYTLGAVKAPSPAKVKKEAKPKADKVVEKKAAPKKTASKPKAKKAE